MISLALASTLLCGQTAPTQAPIIEVIQPMHAGSLSAGSTGGMLSLTPDGRLFPLNPAMRARTTIPAQEARFRFKGPPFARFQITLDPAHPVLTCPARGQVIVSEFLPSPSGTGLVLDAKGEAEFRLGARLDIPKDAPAGLYRSSQVHLGFHLLDAKGTKSAHQSFSISVQLVPDLALFNQSPLNFAGITPGFLSGRFHVSPNGSHHSPDPQGPRLLKGLPHPARFTLRGPAGTCYQMLLPQTVLLSGPGAPILLKDFCSNIALEGQLVDGDLDFNVGGSLVVPPDQPGGNYKGYFNVIICYP